VTGHRVAYADGSWVATSDGPAFLEQGETLPEGVHPDEIARLANAGVLEGIDQEQALVGGDIVAGEPLPAGKVEDLKVRIGTDAELARAYLEQEQASDKPRTSFVAHLEQVIADDAARTYPGTPVVGAGDESGEA
jgi:hypothetical protein